MPPFFEPAMHTPSILENLWQQTLVAYIENPIPALFKEKLAALLARYCSVPYCLICHSSTLRPLGMKASEVLDLLETPLLSIQELESQSSSLPSSQISGWPESGSELEECVLQCCVAIFLHVDSEGCLKKLRNLLSPEYYDYLNLFLCYNRVCLNWAEAHPELSYEADKRTQDNLPGLFEDEPRLKDFFSNYKGRMTEQFDRRLHWLTAENRKLVSDVQHNLEVLKRKESELKERVVELVEEKRMREQFVATMTHDLRTPLATIAMGASMLRKSPDLDPEKSMEIANRLASNANRIDQMITDLLDASRLQTGQTMPLKYQNCVLNEVILELVNDLPPEKRHLLRVVEKSRIQGAFDPEAIRRVVENLVNNAFKYGDEGQPVTITLDAQGASQVKLEVHNFGPVIAPEEQEKLFFPFQRLKSAEASGKKGWGLGLLLVRGIIEAAGGEVGVSSDEKSGTVFWVLLPVTNAH